MQMNDEQIIRLPRKNRCNRNDRTRYFWASHPVLACRLKGKRNPLKKKSTSLCWEEAMCKPQKKQARENLYHERLLPALPPPWQHLTQLHFWKYQKRQTQIVSHNCKCKNKSANGNINRKSDTGGEHWVEKNLCHERLLGTLSSSGESWKIDAQGIKSTTLHQIDICLASASVAAAASEGIFNALGNSVT